MKCQFSNSFQQTVYLNCSSRAIEKKSRSELVLIQNYQNLSVVYHHTHRKNDTESKPKIKKNVVEYLL